MNILSPIAHRATFAANFSGYNRLLRSLPGIEKIQRQRLALLIKEAKNTEFGRKKGLDSSWSWEKWQQNTPVTDYSHWQDAIARQIKTHRAVISHRCLRYQPTSGSTTATRWIPYTKKLLREFDAAASPWLVDMALKNRGILYGKHYWSLSWMPDSLRSKCQNDDLELFSWWKKQWMSWTMAVPSAISRTATSNLATFATLAYLVSCRHLTMISVWSPTFALSLFQKLAEIRDILRETLATGKWPEPQLRFLPCPQCPESSELLREWDGQLNPNFFRALWPRLCLVSSWDTASAAMWAKRLRQLLTHAKFQGKGLWATEGVVTIPFRDHYPLAITSHVYEFRCLTSDKIFSPWQLQEGQIVQPIFSTGSGLWRYALADRVKVTGFLQNCPCLEFIERIGEVDLVGEKIARERARQILDALNEGSSQYHCFSLAAVRANRDSAPYYMVLCEGASDEQRNNSIANSLERLLCHSFHYKLARELGQLQHAKALIATDALTIYQQRMVENGMIEGNIKVEPLVVF